MDQELAAALARVSEHLQASTDAQKTTRTQLQTFGTQLGGVVQRVERIERHVGLGPSDPPPALPLKIIAKDAADRSSSTTLDVDALKAEIIRMNGELVKQSSAMGIGVKSARWLLTSEGRAVVLRLAQLAGIAYLTWLAAVHQSAPPAPPPQLPPAADSR